MMRLLHLFRKSAPEAAPGYRAYTRDFGWTPTTLAISNDICWR
jgi:hypothetical protein